MTFRCLETSGSDYPLTQRDIAHERDPKNRSGSNMEQVSLIVMHRAKGKAIVKGRLSEGNNCKKKLFLE